MAQFQDNVWVINTISAALGAAIRSKSSAARIDSINTCFCPPEGFPVLRSERRGTAARGKPSQAELLRAASRQAQPDHEGGEIKLKIVSQGMPWKAADTA